MLCKGPEGTKRVHVAYTYRGGHNVFVGGVFTFVYSMVAYYAYYVQYQVRPIIPLGILGFERENGKSDDQK